MIQAIENGYDVPASYRDYKSVQKQNEKHRLERDTLKACMFCDDVGFRYSTSEQYPDGAMRRCTHDSTVESRIMPEPKNTS